MMGIGVHVSDAVGLPMAAPRGKLVNRNERAASSEGRIAMVLKEQKV
ncbi:hypothetical protein [Bifidobacterium bifidum]